MNIIYFAGGNRVHTLENIINSSDFTVTQIYVTSIEKNLESYKLIAKKNSIELIIANKNNIVELFNYKNEDILLSVGYRFLIPKTIFSMPPHAINIHPSLLPKYKGAYSGFAIIENGEKESGITAHFLDEGIDTGDMINQKKVILNLGDSVSRMSTKVMKIEPKFVLETLSLIRDKSYKRVVQERVLDEVVYTSKRVPKDSEIDPSLSLLELINRIKACDSERFPAYFMMNNKRVNIKLEFEDEK